jgi:hypothetical protein
MSVERRAIRCHLADELKGRTRAGQNVRRSRFEPIVPEKELEGSEVFASLAVYTLSDQPTISTDTPRTYSRRLELAVEVFAEQGPELDAEVLDDLVDDVADQVECVIEPRIPELARLEIPGTGELLSVNPSKSGLERVDVGFDARGVQLSGAARLVFVIVYGTDVDEREQARATDLESAHLTYRFPPVDLEAPPAAEDEIDLADG